MLCSGKDSLHSPHRKGKTLSLAEGGASAGGVSAGSVFTGGVSAGGVCTGGVSAGVSTTDR